MKIRVCIVVDDGESVAVAFGADSLMTDEEISNEAVSHQVEAGYSGDRLLWAEIEIPPPHPTIEVTAKPEANADD